MEKKTIIVISLLGVAAVLGTIAAVMYKNSRKPDPDKGVDEPQGPGAPINYTTPPAPSIIGKKAYAKFDGTKVYNIIDGYLTLNVYKTAKKDEWIGTVKEIKNGTSVVMENTPRYSPMNNLYFV